MKLIQNPRFRRLLVFTFDFLAIGVAFLFSYFLRFEFNIPEIHLQKFWAGLPYVYVIQTLTFIWFGLYRGMWSFASIRDLFLIVRAVVTGVAFTSLVIAFQNQGFIGWSRSVFILDGFLLVMILGGGRFTYRILREFLFMHFGAHKKILVIGAGQSASFIARELSQRQELSSQVIGFLDDDKRMRGTRLLGAPVLGTVAELESVLSKQHPDEVIIAIPSLTGTRVKDILNVTRQFNIPCRICPPIRDVLLGKVKLNQLREVRVEDLLRRQVSTVDDTHLRGLIVDQSIMVTGGAGSIGSELCRQILKHSPKCLVVYDRSEFNLYRFEQEIRKDFASELLVTDVRFVVGDVLDERRLCSILEQEMPSTVLHAAAYKHVPLMETNIYESLKNNVVGTYNLTHLCAKYGVKTFVLVSTDKAVRPTNVMGATKRMAEMVTHGVGQESGMTTAAVRFGNVLDSEGSVLPLFREQIAQGGPVTVTHPEITRYFMTIPEAAQLVLQASILGKGGEVFLLDMGEPVLIRELAEELIKLSGLKPYEDINIQYTGLRPGEKLYEELLFDLNSSTKTMHPKIMCSQNENNGTLESNWKTRIDEFRSSEKLLSREELMNWIKDWVPEYQNPDGMPSHSGVKPSNHYVH